MDDRSGDRLLRRYAGWFAVGFLGMVAFTCSTSEGGGIRALLDRVPLDCSRGVLTVQVDNRLQRAVNLYQVRSRSEALRPRSGIRLAAQVPTGEATEAICLDRLLGQHARIVLDPVGGTPYLIDGAGAVFFDGVDLLHVRVEPNIRTSTIEVR